MSDQLSLLGDEPRAPYRRESVSSRDGAKAIEKHRRGLLAKALRAYRIAGWEGLTDEELSWALGVKITTAIPRRHELKDRGFVTVKPTGRREGSAGVRVGYWTITEQGRRAA